MASTLIFDVFFFPDMLKLKEIFPTETEAALEEALRFSINVEDAIETLGKQLVSVNIKY